MNHDVTRPGPHMFRLIATSLGHASVGSLSSLSVLPVLCLQIYC